MRVAFDILRIDARRRQTHNGHKVTKIVSAFPQAATGLYRRLFDALPSECLVEFRRAASKDEPAGDPSFKLALQRELGHPVIRARPGRPEKTNLVLFLYSRPARTRMWEAALRARWKR